MNPISTALRKAFPRRSDAPAVGDTRQRRLAVREAVGRGNDARDEGDWTQAATHYAAALALDDKIAGIGVQLGHALKETGKLTEAESAYRQAVDANPDDLDARMQLGHVLRRQGRFEAAIEAYLIAYERNPDLTAARDAIIEAGGRDLLPGAAFGRSAVAERLARLSASLDRTLDEIRDLTVVSAYPVKAWDAFRRQYPVRPHPGDLAGTGVTIIVDARDVPPSALRSTLISLMDQRVLDWTAVVLTPAATAVHPVASFPYIDERIRFAETAEGSLQARDRTPVVYLAGGTVLDREALGWLIFGLSLTDADVAYADHDHFETDWRAGPIYSEPALQGLFDEHDLTTSPRPPAALALQTRGIGTLLEALDLDIDAVERLRRVILAIGKAGTAAHIPRVLCSVPLDQARSAPPPAPPVSDAMPGARVLVVIPTRDEPQMLDRCVRSLVAQAAQPELVDILVLDNRSVLAETAELLERLGQELGIRQLAMDEPFNWARFNNLAVENRDQEIVVFANNDTEMLTSRWDERIRTRLADTAIGILGARLLYPDRTLQHGGIVLGRWQGRSCHEGVGADAREPGPLDRWVRSRQAAAVTGAFMACRRSTFQALGGFDPRLAIAYNDIDLCLRARAQGLAVIYAADIEVLHFESRTRGRNDMPEKVAWDDGELLTMYRRWGDALLFDPGVNPQWVSAPDRPFDGYRDLGHSQILEHLNASARPSAWSIAIDRDRDPNSA